MKTYLFYASTVNIPMGFKPQVYSHGALDFMMQCNEQIFLFSFIMLMWKSKYAHASDGIKRKRNAKKINMDKYRFYLPPRIQCFKSSGTVFVLQVRHLIQVWTLTSAPLDTVSPMFFVCLAVQSAALAVSCAVCLCL